MNNYKLLLAYDGTGYFGWQKTIDGPGIEEEVEKALLMLLKHPISLQVASRTDRGVHAKGQVVNFFSPHMLDLAKTVRSLNGILPQDIAVLSLEKVGATFHPTLDATGKEYHYTLDLSLYPSPFTRKTAYHIPYPLCMEAMQKAASHLIGTHDFTSFTNVRLPKYESFTCTLEKITLNKGENTLVIAMLADRFLYKMARNIAGALIYAALGKIDPDTLPSILQTKERALAPITAPAHGLTLYTIEYR